MVIPSIQNMQNGCGSAVSFVIYDDPKYAQYAKRLRFRSGFARFMVILALQNMQNGCGSAMVSANDGDPVCLEYAKRLRFRSGFCDLW